MIYPQLSEYIDAIKSPEDNFAELTSLRPVRGADGEPVMTSGNFAVVFKMENAGDGRAYAVKCFLRDQPRRAESYRLIADELAKAASPYLTKIRFLDNELFVDSANADGDEFPVLLMDWVEGIPLDCYPRQHLGDRDELIRIAGRFSGLGAWLMGQPFAHGDLKPDNIMVRPDGSLVLIDYDGMYVPAMAGQEARELGSPDFRHPARTEADFNEHIDDFPIASILLSLRAIAADRLLFSESDYRDIASCRLLREIFPSAESEINTFAGLFTIALTQGDLARVSPRLLSMQWSNSGAQQIHIGNVNPPSSQFKSTGNPIIDNLIRNMVYVEGGTFTMGATAEQGDDAYDNVKPPHKVTVSSFSIGKYEVTQKEWEAVMGSNPSYSECDNLPVESVSWDNCQEFIRKLNSLTGKNFRLPTEAEWEYAARGGNESQGYKYSGSDNIDDVAWYRYNSGGTTHEVGTKSPNELGLYDMSGNVMEWCFDWYDDYSSDAQTNPTGPSSGSYRVRRGGSRNGIARSCRVSRRIYITSGYRLNYFGLRLAS